MARTRRDRYRQDRRGGGPTHREAGDFLFDRGSVENEDKEVHESRGLEMRTRVIGPESMKGLAFYGTLRDAFDSKAARVVSDILKRLLIGHNGMGRTEAVHVLRGGLPHEVEIEIGNEPLKDGDQDTGFVS